MSLQEEGRWTQTHGPMREEGHAEEETETGAVHGQAKAHQGMWTTNRNREETAKTLPFSLQRKHGPADTLVSDI